MRALPFTVSSAHSKSNQTILLPHNNVSRIKLIAAFAAVYFIWGSTFLGIRFGLETMPPFFLAGTRFIIAGATLYWFAKLRGAPKPTARQWRDTTITGALFFLIGNGAVVWAQQTVPSGIAALLVAIIPLWVVLLQWIRPPHHRPVALVSLGVLLGLGGLALLIGPRSMGGSIDPVGAGILGFGSLCWAYGTLYAGKADFPKMPIQTSAMQLLTGGIFLGLASIVTGELSRIGPETFALKSTLAVLYLIVFGSWIAFTAYSWLTRVASPSLLATYAYVNPVVAVFLGWVFANEALTTRMLLAAAVIIFGVAMITLGTARSGVREIGREGRAGR